MKDEKNDNKLDQKTIKEIEKQLLERKGAVEKELQELSNNGDSSKGAKFPDYGDKPDENAQEIGEYTTNLATENVLEKTLRDIDGALARIKKGEYGICKYCGEEIGGKRMQARPVASACVKCKTKLQSTN